MKREDVSKLDMPALPIHVEAAGPIEGYFNLHIGHDRSGTTDRVTVPFVHPHWTRPHQRLPTCEMLLAKQSAESSAPMVPVSTIPFTYRPLPRVPVYKSVCYCHTFANSGACKHMGTSTGCTFEHLDYWSVWEKIRCSQTDVDESDQADTKSLDPISMAKARAREIREAMLMTSQ